MIFDPTAIANGFALAATIVGAVLVIIQTTTRLRSRERLRALEKDPVSAAAIVADAVVSFRLNTGDLIPSEVHDVVRREIEARDRRNRRQLVFWVVETVVAAAVVLGLAGGGRVPGPPDDTSELLASMNSNIDLGRYDDAITQISEVLDRNPNNYRALSGKGEIEFYRRHYATAADYFRRALQQQPRNRILKMNLADALVEVQDYDAAIQAYDSIAERQEDVMYGKGRALLYAGRFAEALEQLESVSPSFQRGKGQILSAAANYQIGHQKSDDARMSIARQEFENGFKVDPTYWEGVLSGDRPDIHEGHAITSRLLGDLYKERSR